MPGIKCRYDKLVPLDELKPNPANPNTHTNAQIQRLSEIFEYQGIRHPIVVSKQSSYITKGHGRLAAAKLLDMKEFPVEYQDYDNAEQEHADVVADNAIASWAELDFSMINAELPDFSPDFNIDMLGIKDFILEPAEKFELDEKINDSAKQKFILQVQFNDESEMISAYEKLLGEGFIVRYL